MAAVNVYDVVLLSCLGFVAVTGTTLNVITMYILLRDKILRKKMASVRWLMFGEALSETVVCAIGAPLMFANILVGNAPPFSTTPILCYPVEMVSWGCPYVSVWYQTTIALTRLAAVLAPSWYKSYLRRNFISTLALVVFPWLIGYVAYAVGYMVGAFRVYPTPGSGICYANPYDDSPEADRYYAYYVMSDAILHAWIPMPVGLLCYGIIYSKKWLPALSRLLRNRKFIKVQPQTTTGTRTDNATLEGNSKTIREQPAQPSQVAAPNPDGTVALTGNSAKEERYSKVKILAVAYVINICLVFPSTGIAWGFNYYGWLAENMPALNRLLDVMNLMAFPINPLLYLLVSNDFRQAVLRVFKRST